MSSNNQWTDDFKYRPRKQQELRLQPKIDDIYVWFFNDKHLKVERHEQAMLDLHLGIDTTIHLRTGNLVTVQEKTLSFHYAGFNTLTVEYYNDPRGKDVGDWFTMMPQLYFCGYESQDYQGFCKYILVNWASLMMATLSKRVKWSSGINKDGRSKAMFKTIKFDEIPRECVLVHCDLSHPEKVVYRSNL